MSYVKAVSLQVTFSVTLNCHVLFCRHHSSTSCLSPQHADVQPGLARGVWLPARWEWTHLYSVRGGRQQRPPGRAAAGRPGPGDRRPQCVDAGSSGCRRHRSDSEEHPAEYRSGVSHTAGLFQLN